MLVKIQSRTSIKTASLMVNEAMWDSLHTIPTMLSKVGIWGLEVRGVKTPEDSEGKNEVVGFGGGFAVREEAGW